VVGPCTTPNDVDKYTNTTSILLVDYFVYMYVHGHIGQQQQLLGHCFMSPTRLQGLPGLIPPGGTTYKALTLLILTQALKNAHDKHAKNLEDVEAKGDFNYRREVF
jgi:hypothetical protein